MRKEFFFALGCLALFCSLAVWARAGESAPEPSANPLVSDPSVVGVPGTSGLPLEPNSVSAKSAATVATPHPPAPFGFTYCAVSQDLIAQLGSACSQGVVVLSVQAAQEQGDVGVQPHDVILEIDGQAAAERLAHPDGDSTTADPTAGLELRVIRGGILRTVTLGNLDSPTESSEAGAQDAFLSARDLKADHPFRRAMVWEELRGSYEEGSEHYRELARTAKDKRNQARQEAKEAAKLLRSQAAEEVEAAFQRAENELLARVDEALSTSACSALDGLGLGTEELLDEESAAQVEQQLLELNAAFALAISDQLVMQAGSEKEVASVRKSFLRLAEEAERLGEERVAQVWREAKRSLADYKKNLGPEARDRAGWCAERVEGIRVHLHERITCAFDRAAEELDQQLARRLQDLDLPAPGELATAVNEIEAQVDRMAEYFLRQTAQALSHYADDVARRDERLLEEFTNSLSYWKQDAPRLRSEFIADTAHVFGKIPLTLDDGWRGRTRLDKLRGDLRGLWRGSITEQRDAIRASIGTLPRSLKEHFIACEDAWRDVRDLLGNLHSSSNNNCWKLDGPYLDGRFPEASEHSGDVALLVD